MSIRIPPCDQGLPPGPRPVDDPVRNMRPTPTIRQLAALAWLAALSAGCKDPPASDARLEALRPPATRPPGMENLPRPEGGGEPRLDDRGVIDTPPVGLLIQAIQTDELAQARTLLAAGVDPNARDARGQTALTALFSGRNWQVGEAMLELLLEHRADPNAPDLLGRTPLHGAVERGRLKLLRRLLAAGARPTVADREGSTALHRAVELDRLEEAGLLLAHQADPLALDGRGRSPLHLAVHKGSFWLTRLLCDAPGALAARDKEGRSPLHLAVAAGNLELAGLLLERGADPELEDEEGHRPMGWLARNCVAFMDARLEQPGSLADHACLRNPRLRSACLFQAAAEGRDEVAGLLLERGASPADLHGFHPGPGTRASALHVAAWAGQARLVTRLLAAGAAPDARDANGWTALHTAAWQGHHAAAERLLAAGADPRARTRAGETALELARQREHGPLVLLLTSSGGKPRRPFGR